MLLLPLGMLARELDLGLWLMAPILTPAVYASYCELFARETPPAKDGNLDS